MPDDSKAVFGARIPVDVYCLFEFELVKRVKTYCVVKVQVRQEQVYRLFVSDVLVYFVDSVSGVKDNVVFFSFYQYARCIAGTC